MSTMTEKLAIREVVENWVLWRDAGDWERFRTVWTDDGHSSEIGDGCFADSFHFADPAYSNWPKARSMCSLSRCK